MAQDPTLYLPRILCLRGGWLNAKALRLQS